MTRLQELKADEDAAWYAYLDAREATCDATFADAWEAYLVAWEAYQAEIKKQKANSRCYLGCLWRWY